MNPQSRDYSRSVEMSTLSAPRGPVPPSKFNVRAELCSPGKNVTQGFVSSVTSHRQRPSASCALVASYRTHYCTVSSLVVRVVLTSTVAHDDVTMDGEEGR